MAAFYVLLGILLYFAPTIIAAVRKTKANVKQVVVINLLLGWTFIGWIVALVMSLSDTGRQATVQVNIHNSQEGNTLP
jgi:uncharacterized membrane protein